MFPLSPPLQIRERQSQNEDSAATTPPSDICGIRHRPATAVSYYSATAQRCGRANPNDRLQNGHGDVGDILCSSQRRYRTHQTDVQERLHLGRQAQGETTSYSRCMAILLLPSLSWNGVGLSHHSFTPKKVGGRDAQSAVQ